VYNLNINLGISKTVEYKKKKAKGRGHRSLYCFHLLQATKMKMYWGRWSHNYKAENMGNE